MTNRLEHLNVNREQNTQFIDSYSKLARLASA